METKNIQERFDACIKRRKFARAMALFSYPENRMLLSDKSLKRWLINDIQAKYCEAGMSARVWKNQLLDEGRSNILQEVVSSYINNEPAFSRKNGWQTMLIFELCPDEFFQKKVITYACENDLVDGLHSIKARYPALLPSVDDITKFLTNRINTFTVENYFEFVDKPLYRFMKEFGSLVPDEGLDPVAQWWEKNNIPKPQAKDYGHVNHKILVLMFSHPRAFSNQMIDRAVKINCDSMDKKLWGAVLSNAEKIKTTKRPLF